MAVQTECFRVRRREIFFNTLIAREKTMMKKTPFALVFLSLLIALLCGIDAHAENVYVQDFNGDWPYDGWTDHNPDHGEKFEWESLKSMTCEGSGAIAHTSENHPARTWVASPDLELISSNTYTCSFQQRVGNAAFPERMATYIWKGAPADFDPEHGSAILIWKGEPVANTTCAAHSKAFAVSATGRDYHVVFYCTTNANEYLAIWDDLVVWTLSAPVVSTTPATHITATTAQSGGTVTSDGGTAVTDRGVCWSVNPNPTLHDSYTEDGSGTGTFTSSLSGLTPGATYHVRAYASNAEGTAYGNDLTFTEGSVTPTVSTADLSNITAATAQSGGNVTSDGGASVTARGVCWSTAPDPTVANNHTVNGAGTGAFTSRITGLSPGTEYHVRAYAANANGTAYGSEKIFTTGSTLPDVSTADISHIASTTAQGGGNVTSDGGDAVLARGVCWSAHTEPTIADAHTTDGSGTGAFTSQITGLTPGATYHVRAYATNGNGTAYGSEKTFISGSMLPEVSTADISNVTSTTAQGGGNVTADGGIPVTDRGVCWSANPNPTIHDKYTSDGTGTGVFLSQLTELSPGKVYHVRAYATNGNGTAYGSEKVFSSQPQAPTVTTADIKHITPTGAQGGGNVESDGGAAVLARGVCWSASPHPTIADTHTTDGDGIGQFTSAITGLKPGTKYFVRAFATNAQCTAYGGELSFTTDSVLPTVYTTPATHITSTTAQSGGNVAGDGGDTVTARGVCWSSHPNPSLSDTCTSDGSGKGGFTSQIIGLTPGATYHVRAYAANANGTAYGSDLSFTEGSEPPTVSTAQVTNITAGTAQGGGNVSSDGGTTVTARGVCWGANPNPSLADNHTSDGAGTGVFTSRLTDLDPGKVYHVRAYAANGNGTAYGSDLSFTTGSLTPTVSTAPATHISSTTAQSGGNVSSDGGATVTARGVCWSDSSNPTTADSHTFDGQGTGSFNSDITGLTPGATYHVRAYAANANGTAYGKDLTFTEGSEAPTVSTIAITNITPTTARSEGNVTSDGGAAVTSRGVCWSDSPNPTTADSHTFDGQGTGSFNSDITGLTPGATCHVRAYAVNANGTAYGKNLTFTSGSLAPTVSTAPATHITPTTAQSGGDVADDGGAKVSARGACWSTNPNPALPDAHTIDGTGTGGFTSRIEGLTPGATYHVRAYATNANGTAYGRDLAFTEESEPPTVSTASITHITATTALGGGTVVDNGGASVTVRGVCWSTVPNPTVPGKHTEDGEGVGSFTSSIEGLIPNTTYHIRAYATNAAGTGYGADIPFTTSPPAPAIDKFTPHAGGYGTSVAITGTGFNEVNSVRFGGTDAKRFEIDSDTCITAIVGPGSSGHITVISPWGTATSAEAFTYLAEPVPALNIWGFIAISILLAGISYWKIRKQASFSRMRN